MPNKEFLEQYPLYRKFKTDNLPHAANQLKKVQIKMSCPVCKADQTFVMTNEYHENCEYSNYLTKGIEFRLRYICVHCQQFFRYFYVKVDDQAKSITKIGQFPPWSIQTDSNIERLLGEHSDYYKKGLICESQGYGIGAFAYYRRIVEEIIDNLLDEISELLEGDEKSRFLVAITEAKKTTVTQEKIDLVKDLLPPILRPDDMNPLATLHSVLSEGLHAESDENCIEYAMGVREVLVFLVNQVAASRAAAKSFTTSMRKLLEKKARREN